MKSNYTYGSLAPFVDIASLNWEDGFPLIFVNNRPLEIEIGFGTGEYLAGLSAGSKDVNFIGFEQCPTRIIKTLRKLHQVQACNTRIFRIDAAWGFRYILAAGSVSRVHCLFPCPWPKSKHVKHRLFQPDFLRLVYSRLKSGGIFRIVTDHHPYAEWIGEQVQATGFTLKRKMIGAVHGTKFEKKWQEGGQEVFDEILLTADKPCEYGDVEVSGMKIYFCQEFIPQRMLLEGVTGRVTISFSDQLYDSAREAGMVHAVVSEDNRVQHVWVMIERTPKGWRVAPAAGTAILPTEGIRKAIELVFQAVERSGK